MKFNLGCGNDYRQGWVNIDQRPEVSPDRIVDLKQLPWPIEDNSADEILLKHVLEHLGHDDDAFQGVMQELYRISKPGATLRVQVRHPRRDSFISVPTSLRPILPETFSYFDLATVEAWQESHLPGTPFARYLKVDFELTNVQHHLTPYWLKELQEGRIDAAGILRAIENYNNVVEWTDITLSARKPFRPGHALRAADAICLERHGGTGEVLMALAAAKALKSLTDRPIVLVTAPAFQALAAACPHVDAVANDVDSLRRQFVNLKHLDLNQVAFGISRLHQVDAYLQAFGLSVDALPKDIDITVDAAAEQEAADLLASWPQRPKGRARILLDVHGEEANVTWPRERWQSLADELLALGHQVVVIGSDASQAGSDGALKGEGLLDAYNRLSPLATVALMRQADVLVSADGDALQFAAASDIGIVGLFSVAAGSSRLPFRQGVAGWRAEAVKPSCRFHPCYRYVLDSETTAPFLARLQNGTLTAAELFSSWCPDGGSFACMKEQISVSMVLDAIGRLDPALLERKGSRKLRKPTPEVPRSPAVRKPKAAKTPVRKSAAGRSKAASARGKPPTGRGRSKT
jgi:ADP-heptose:LPS heptosyltransferase